MASLLKRTLTTPLGDAALRALIAAVEWYDAGRTNLLRVLMYHRVDWPDARPQLHGGLISATPEEFSRQADFLAGHCRVVRLADVLAAFRGEQSLPPQAVLLTFDDAYADFAEHAWPALRQRGLPAALMVPTGLPDRPGQQFWWDRLAAAVSAADGALETPLGRLDVATPRARAATLRQLTQHVKTLPHERAMQLVECVCADLPAPTTNQVLGWEQLQALAAEGLEFGAHTVNHPLMHRLPLPEARREARQSLADLRCRLGPVPAVFAYPAGGFSREVVQMLRDEGYELALTTCRGINQVQRCDPLLLRRINVGRRTSVNLLRAQLLPLARHCNAALPVKSSC